MNTVVCNDTIIPGSEKTAVIDGYVVFWNGIKIMK